MNFVVYPAIDVRDHQVVRLAQGDYGRETRYPVDPFELACRYADAGAQWLHLVDLDAARSGGYGLLPLLGRIKRETPLRVQTGGGMRAHADVQRLLDAGADRVVVGSMAVDERHEVAGWIARHGPEQLAVALDARCGADGCWWPATHGWTRPAEVPLADMLRFYERAGLVHLLCTDIARDGMLAGPNLDLYARVAGWSASLRVQASGGVRDAADIDAARASGCAGVVLGKALLDGRLDPKQALQA